MKILIVSQYYYPEQFQINEIAPALVNRGHEVTVLTGLPNYPKGEIYDGYRNGERRDEIIEGVHVIRCRLHPRKHGPLHLVMNYISFSQNACKTVRKLEENYDIVFSYQLSPITMVKPAIVYAKSHRVPLLLYCLDIWPESAQAYVKSDKGLIYRMITALSKKYYGVCDHIAVTSRPFIEYLHDKNEIPVAKMSYIPQHADAGYLDMNLQSEDNGIIDFMYAGNMGKGQVLDVIVRAVAELKDFNNFVVHMVGDGSKKNEVEALAERLGVKDKFIFYGNQKRENMPSFYQKADALLLTLRGNNFVGNTMPGKLQVYMTVGKPIFGAINGAASEVITESQCGKCVAAGDYRGLAQMMRDFVEHPDAYVSCGDKAKAYFSENFTLTKYMDELEDQMKALVDHGV